MTGRRTDRSSALLPPTLAVGMLALLWAATAGPPAIMSPSGRRRAVPSAVETATAPPTDDSQTLEELTRDIPATHDLSWLGDLLAWAVLLALGTGAVLLGRLAWQHRWRRPAAPPDVPFEALPSPAVARALAERLDALADVTAQGSPRNAIVRCWLALEEAVAEAGLPRLRHETAAEFTVRVLHRLDLDPATIGRLAALYREARFSDHTLGEDARTQAGAALDQLREELRRAGAVR